MHSIIGPLIYLLFSLSNIFCQQDAILITTSTPTIEPFVINITESNDDSETPRPTPRLLSSTPTMASIDPSTKDDSRLVTIVPFVSVTAGYEDANNGDAIIKVSNAMNDVTNASLESSHTVASITVASVTMASKGIDDADGKVSSVMIINHNQDMIIGTDDDGGSMNVTIIHDYERQDGRMIMNGRHENENDDDHDIRSLSVDQSALSPLSSLSSPSSSSASTTMASATLSTFSSSTKSPLSVTPSFPSILSSSSSNQSMIKINDISMLSNGTKAEMRNVPFFSPLVSSHHGNPYHSIADQSIDRDDYNNKNSNIDHHRSNGNNFHYQDQSRTAIGGREGMMDGGLKSNNCPVACSCSLTSTRFLQPETLLRTVNCTKIGVDVSFTPFIPSDVENLILSRNNLNEIISIESNHLLILDLSYNQIKRIGRVPMASVHHINPMASNQQQHVFKDYSHLKILDLSGNDFKTLFSNTFKGLKRLETLILNHGSLKYLDEHSLSGLESLKTLDVSYNKIASLYLELFQNTPNIVIINLASNQITHLSNGVFASLTSLKELILASNQISGMSDNAFVGLDSLSYLDLSYNKLTKVPSIALQTLKRLQTLRLSGNLFKTLSTGDFVHSPINTLHLDHNLELMTTERGSFWDLPSLSVLHLDNNPRLYYMDANTFLGIPSIDTIYLHNDSLITLEEEMVNNLIHHRSQSSFIGDAKMVGKDKGKIKITFYSNPIRCDCNAAFLITCLKSADSCSIKLQDNMEGRMNANMEDANTRDAKGGEAERFIVCSSPLSLIGTKVSELILHQEGNNVLEQRHLRDNKDDQETLSKESNIFISNATSNDVLEAHSKIDAKIISTNCPPIIVDEDSVSHRDPVSGIKNNLTGARASNHSISIIHKRVGEKLTLNCRSLSPLASVITWILPSGQVVNDTNANVHRYQSFDHGPLSHLSVKPNPGTLRLNHLSDHDAGVYTCISKNNVGQDVKNYELIIDALDLHIWPLGVSSTFVTVVWNGTSRDAFPVFHLLYKEMSDANLASDGPDYDSDDDDHEEVTNNWSSYTVVGVSHFLRSYTINHLLPKKKYKLCIGLKDTEASVSASASLIKHHPLSVQESDAKEIKSFDNNGMRRRREDSYHNHHHHSLSASLSLSSNLDDRLLSSPSDGIMPPGRHSTILSRVQRHYLHAHQIAPSSSESIEHPNETPKKNLFSRIGLPNEEVSNHDLPTPRHAHYIQLSCTIVTTSNQLMIKTPSNHFIVTLSLLSLVSIFLSFMIYITYISFRRIKMRNAYEEQTPSKKLLIHNCHCHYHNNYTHANQIGDSSCCSTPIRKNGVRMARELLKETTFSMAVTSPRPDANIEQDAIHHSSIIIETFPRNSTDSLIKLSNQPLIQSADPLASLSSSDKESGLSNAIQMDEFSYPFVNDSRAPNAIA